MATFYTDPAMVPLASARALLIVDADEVLLRFADGFDKFLAARGCYLDLVSYRLHGNVRRRDDNSALLDIEVTVLVDEFRADLDWLEPVAGARETIAALTPLLDIVVLSNVTASQATPRLRNLAAHGLARPLLINSGPKGPAVEALARRSGRPVFFVDDIPQHLASVADASPDIFRIHLIGDERLNPLQPLSPHAHLRADNWEQAGAFIRTQLAQGNE
ncbi:MAG: hypothetical protein ACLQUZ_12395 [Rhizomicrobium sp.]